MRCFDLLETSGVAESGSRVTPFLCKKYADLRHSVALIRATELPVPSFRPVIPTSTLLCYQSPDLHVMCLDPGQWLTLVASLLTCNICNIPVGDAARVVDVADDVANVHDGLEEVQDDERLQDGRRDAPLEPACARGGLLIREM